MSMVSNPSSPALPDYVPPATAAPDSDNEIIEGPSRISLNCPISFKRIKTPVKGHLCKHLQCFDFDNYVGINSRRPLWRCSHCNQSVCFHDIRIDQSMVKVLKAVGANVSHVKISADGTWESVTEGDDHTDKPHDKAPLHPESTTFQDVGAHILDLTEGHNDMDASNSSQNDDSKPSPAELQGQPNVNSQTPSYMNTNKVHRNIAPHMEDGFCREIYLPTHATRISNTRPDVTMLAPVTDTVLNTISQGQSQISASNNMQLQQYNSNNISDEYGRYPTLARHITRNPIAVQALPVQTSVGMVSGERQQQFSRFHLNLDQVSHMISAPPSQHMGSQNWVHHDRSHVSSQPVQQFGARSGPPQQSSGYQYTSAVPADRFNSHQQQSLNQRIPNPGWSPAQLSPQVHQGGVGPTTGLGSNQQAHHYSMAAAQQAIQIRSWAPFVPAPVLTSGSSLLVASLEDQGGPGPGPGQAPWVLEGSAYAPADQNWQPTGHMLGSLLGRAYSHALNQFIIHPTQLVQDDRPPVLNTPRPVIPPHLQVLMANNRDSSIGGSAVRVLPDK